MTTGALGCVCGAEMFAEKVVFKNGTEHIKLVCTRPCGRSLGYLPKPVDKSTAGDFVLWFGKHKGRSLKEVKNIDIGYLEWIAYKSDLKDNLKERCVLVINGHY